MSCEVLINHHIFLFQEKEYELSEVFEHELDYTHPSGQTEEKTIYFSASNHKKYLYNVENEQDSNAVNLNEKADKQSKPKNDGNTMENEIIAFVPTDAGDWEMSKTHDIHKAADKMSNEIPIKETKVDVENAISVETTPHSAKKENNITGQKAGIELDNTTYSAEPSASLPKAIGVKRKSKSSRNKARRAKGNMRSFRNRKGYHASSGPLDFLKKKYKSEFLEVKIMELQLIGIDNVI